MGANIDRRIIQGKGLNNSDKYMFYEENCYCGPYPTLSIKYEMCKCKCVDFKHA